MKSNINLFTITVRSKPFKRALFLTYSNTIPIDCYYDLIKTIEVDPQFDATQARKKLRHYVQHEQRTIDLKTRIMVDHFHEQVIALRKLAGKARAMVVCVVLPKPYSTTSVLKAYLQTIKSPYQSYCRFFG